MGFFEKYPHTANVIYKNVIIAMLFPFVLISVFGISLPHFDGFTYSHFTPTPTPFDDIIENDDANYNTFANTTMFPIFYARDPWGQMHFLNPFLICLMLTFLVFMDRGIIAKLWSSESMFKANGGTFNEFKEKMIKQIEPVSWPPTCGVYGLLPFLLFWPVTMYFPYEWEHFEGLMSILIEYFSESLMDTHIGDPLMAVFGILMAILMVYILKLRPPAFLCFIKTPCEILCTLFIFICTFILPWISTVGIRIKPQMTSVKLFYVAYILPEFALFFCMEILDMYVAERSHFRITTRNDIMGIYFMIYIQLFLIWVCSLNLSVYTYPAVVVSQVLFLTLMILIWLTCPLKNDYKESRNDRKFV
jgi:hypothetical protein